MTFKQLDWYKNINSLHAITFGGQYTISEYPTGQFWLTFDSNYKDEESINFGLDNIKVAKKLANALNQKRLKLLSQDLEGYRNESQNY